MKESNTIYIYLFNLFCLSTCTSSFASDCPIDWLFDWPPDSLDLGDSVHTCGMVTLTVRKRREHETLSLREHFEGVVVGEVNSCEANAGGVKRAGEVG